VSTLIYIRKNPFNLLLLLALLGSVILFFVLSLVFFTRVAAPDWQNFKLPLYFWISSGIMIISSASLWQAKANFGRENFENYKNWLAVTLVLGLLFLLLQTAGVVEMWQGGIKWQHISGAFVFLLGGLHAFHIVLGLVWIFIIYVKAASKRTYVDSFIQSLNPMTGIHLKLLSWYWHFVDALWLYLFIAFLLGNAF